VSTLIADAPTTELAPAQRPVRLLVADDSELVYWGLRALLSRQPWIQRCVHARTVAQALDLCAQYEPNVAVVGARLEAAAPEPLARLLAEASPGIGMLLMSSTPLPRQRIRAAGAAGALALDATAADVIGLIRAVASGAAVPPPADDGEALLSEREAEVLQLVADGATNREIANRLFLSPHTVKQHTCSLYRKLRVRNRTEAVRRAQHVGLLRGR
jgi:DNA-binding NarL/FixJ family response regulator